MIKRKKYRLAQSVSPVKVGTKLDDGSKVVSCKAMSEWPGQEQLEPTYLLTLES